MRPRPAFADAFAGQDVLLEDLLHPGLVDEFAEREGEGHRLIVMASAKIYSGRKEMPQHRGGITFRRIVRIAAFLHRFVQGRVNAGVCRFEAGPLVHAIQPLRCDSYNFPDRKAVPAAFEDAGRKLREPADSKLKLLRLQRLDCRIDLCLASPGSSQSKATTPL